MSVVIITLPDGRSWTPRFVQRINEATCIGCGRCFRVCGRDVFELVGVDEEGARIPVRLDADDDDDDEAEYEKKVMTIINPQNCIGCEACARICPKKCHSHSIMEWGEAL